MKRGGTKTHPCLTPFDGTKTIHRRTFGEDYVTWNSRRKHGERYKQSYVHTNYENFVNLSA